MADAPRVAFVKSALKADDIQLQSFEGAEELGRPYKFTVELLCSKSDLELDDQLGKPLTVWVELPGGKKRYFTGLVSHIAYAGVRFEQFRYVAEVRPWVWFLGFSSDNRIFQNKSVPDIVAEVFSDHGQSVKKNLSGSHKAREYCVQYGETDLDFVSRLMEEDGIYYFFEHDKDGKLEMILADSPSSHAVFDQEYAEIEYFPPSEAAVREHDHIDFWEMRHQVETTIARSASYNFDTPKADLAGMAKKDRKHGESKHELYEYGKLYATAKDGEDRSKIRLQEQQSAYQVASGAGDVRGIAAGCIFGLKNCERPDQNAKYLVIRSGYNLVNNDIGMAGSGGGASFHCYFSAIPEKTQFRSQQITPKARVRGPQTAVVVGPKGEEIYTDKYGRIKVQFHWDRLGADDENAGCWIRVSTGIAGQKWGMIAIPRIGQEVIVDFLEGDPDQPIVVGSLYNSANMPPYDLPANMTQSGFKSRSTKEGTAKAFNEIRFEDKEGSEEIYVHAEHNYTRIVENDDVLKVGLDDKDKGDQTIEIHNDRTATLKEGTDSLKVEKGDQKIDVKKKIDIKAGDELKITVGQSSLVMKKDGTITINGKDLKLDFKMNIKGKAAVGLDLKATQVKVAGTGTLDIKAGGMTTVKGAMVDINGSAMAKLKGGLTMIG